MSKPYRLVVFDWEGTLGDTLGQVLNTVAVEAERLQFGKMNDQLARQNIVFGLPIMLKKLFPDRTLSEQQQLLEGVQQSLISRSHEIYVFPGVKSLLTRMQETGIELAIATNKGQQSLQRALCTSGLDTFFKVTRSAGQTPPKPCPQMLQEIMEWFEVMPQHTLMIGDSVTDIEMAVSIDVQAIGVDFYNQPEQAAELLAAGALRVFEDYQQLADYLQL